MQVTFRKRLSQRMVEWEVVDRTRYRRPHCSTAPARAELPRDLERFVVEAAIGTTRGYWGSIAREIDSATANAKRRESSELDHLIQIHVALAAQGRPTPAAEPLAKFRRLWAELGEGGSFTVEWPTLRVLQPV